MAAQVLQKSWETGLSWAGILGWNRPLKLKSTEGRLSAHRDYFLFARHPLATGQAPKALPRSHNPTLVVSRRFTGPVACCQAISQTGNVDRLRCVVCSDHQKFSISQTSLLLLVSAMASDRPSGDETAPNIVVLLE